MKPFQKNSIRAEGLILPYESFSFFPKGEPPFDPDKMAVILKKAEEYLEKEIQTAPLWSYRQYQESGSVIEYSRFYGERLTGLIYLGFAEGYEKKGRFTEKLCDYVWAILEMASWVLPEHTPHAVYGYTKVPAVVGNKYEHGLELGSIYMGATLAMVYHLAKDALDSISPIISERLEYEVYHRIIEPYLNTTFTWSGERGEKVNNWCPWNVSNILLITAILVRDSKQRTDICNKAIRHLDNFVSFYKEDGGCDEGPTYWGAAAGSLFESLEMLYLLSDGKINIFSEPIIKAMGEYIVSFNICDSYFINFADSSSTVFHDGSLIRRYGERVGSEELIAFGDVMSSRNGIALQFRHPWRSYVAMKTPKVSPDKVVPKAKKSVYFGDLKVMIERQSEDPREGFLLSVKGGHNGESHNHNDVGSFIVYYCGKPVLIDAGVGTYTKKTFSAQRYDIWSMQSNYHNLPMFDGIGEMQGAAYSSRGEVYNPDERSFTAEISGAYPKAAGVLAYTRRAELTDKGPIITDKISLDQKRRIDFVFMSKDEPTLIRDGELALGMERRLIYDSDKLSCEIDAHDPEGMNAERLWGTKTLWRIRLYTHASEITTAFEIR